MFLFTLHHNPSILLQIAVLAGSEEVKLVVAEGGIPISKYY